MEYGVSELVVNASPVSQPQAISLRDGDRWQTTFGSSRTTSSSAVVDHRTTIGYPPFWRGVNLLANGVAGLPLDVFRRVKDDRQLAPRHPAYGLLKRQANPVIRARKLRKTLTAHALLFGNGFAWIERDERMNPVALWPLDPQRVVVRYMDTELWYCTTIEGQQAKFPGRDVLHISGLSHNGIVGYSAIDLMADALGVGLAAQQFGARFFGQGANMSGILMVPGHFSDEKIQNTLNAWGQMHEGLSKSHKVALLQDGVKFQPFSVAPDQAQFLQTRNYEVRAVVANILGVPPHLLGDDSRTSHNSLESENQSFLNHSLNPWLNEWEGECEGKLLREQERATGSHFIEFNREAAVQMEFKEKIEGMYRQMEMGISSPNEQRRRLNMPGIGPDGDKRFRPANWLELGAAATDAVPSAADPPQEEIQEGAAMNVLRAMVESSVTDAIAIEKRRVVDAAGKESNFLEWLDGFYETWCGKSVGGMSSAAAANAKREHAAESRRQLLDVAGASTSSTLVENVQSTVATWDGRAETLVLTLMEAVK